MFAKYRKFVTGKLRILTQSGVRRFAAEVLDKEGKTAAAHATIYDTACASGLKAVMWGSF